MTLGERIKQLRKQLSYSQKELAKILNVSNSTICNYENGISNPDLEILAKMADIFSVSIDYLLDYKPNNYESFPLIDIPVLIDIQKPSSMFNRKNIAGYIKLPVFGHQNNRLFGIKLPDSNDKGSLYIITPARQLNDGKYGLFYSVREHNCIIRKCYTDGDFIILVPRTVSERNTIRISKKDSNLFTLIGEIIGSVNNL